jgi:general secretion pathway protein A
MYNEHYGFLESPFKATPDPRFFFVNPCYEEAFATLRYGIGSRKGMIVATGEAGTGKTTLLKRLMHSFEPNVHAACIFDPHLTFAELLRCALTELGVTIAGEDRLTLMAQIYDYLVRQFESGQIVSLMIDEAQNLSEEMLEELRLLSNLETDSEKLLQIVLVGQPEFEEKLDEPRLLQLKQRVVLRCRLRPLEAHEVGSYIRSRLKTVGCERQDLFDSESLERIALYSKGIPRLVNIICDNAMLMAYANHGGRASIEEVDEVARELKLLDATQSSAARFGNSVDVRADLLKPGPSRTPKAVFRGDLSAAEWDPSFVFIEERAPARNRLIRSHARGVRVLLILLIALNAVLVFSDHQAGLSFSAVGKYIDKLATLGQENKPSTPGQKDRNAMPEAARENFPPLAQGSSEDSGPYQDATGDSDPVDILPETERKEESVSKESTETPKKNRSVSNERPSIRSSDDKAITTRKLEFAVYKAIHEHAIRGVEVSAIDGIVYLDGQVATRQQKLAAVRATLGVPGVKDIRNRIVVIVE